MSNHTEFQRLNYFTGLFTTAEDWSQEQTYHLEKRKLHLRGLHSPGVIPGEGDECRVRAAGGLAVRVSSGAVVDRDGNLVVLPPVSEVAIELPSDLPATVYVVVEAWENPADFRLNPEDEDYSGNARVAEAPRVSFTYEPPENHRVVELARVALQPDVTELRDPADPLRPAANEIDMRWAPHAGARDGRFQAIGERLVPLHRYHLEQQQRHHRGLFQAGIMRGLLDELDVVPAGGLTVHVKPGVALDSAGHELYLDGVVPVTFEAPADSPRRVYLAARYEDDFAGYLSQLGRAAPGTYRTLQVATRATKPDWVEWIELAHVDLEAGATEVRLPADPASPQPNEIDRRDVAWAAALAVTAPRLPAALRQRIAQLMRKKRGDFAALATRFPAPSATDVRQAALIMEMLARNDSLKAETLAEVLTMLMALEQDAGQEIGAAYPPVVDRPEYQDYVAAVTALHDALRAGEQIDVILNYQETASTAARGLAGVIFQAPTADAGPDQVVTSTDDTATVTLDASESEAFDDQKIVGYRWEKEE